MSGNELTVSHVGICVADLARATQFYCEALGFASNESFEVEGEIGEVMDLSNEVVVRSQFIKRDGVRLVLMCFEFPRPQQRQRLTQMNETGLTHICLRVDDIDVVAERILACGGQPLRYTRRTTPYGEYMYCLDPDGVRLELMRLPPQLQLV